MEYCLACDTKQRFLQGNSIHTHGSWNQKPLYQTPEFTQRFGLSNLILLRANIGATDIQERQRHPPLVARQARFNRSLSFDLIAAVFITDSRAQTPFHWICFPPANERSVLEVHLGPRTTFLLNLTEQGNN